MRILMVNKYLYPRAGAETYMINLAKELIKEGHEIAFFGMEHPENVTFAPLFQIPFLNFSKSAPFSTQVSSLCQTAWDRLTHQIKREFQRCLDAFSPDIIHAHNIYNQLPPDLFVFKQRAIPVLMTVHDYKIVCPSYNLFSRGQPCENCLSGSFIPCIKQKCIQGSLLKSTLAAASSGYHQWKKTYQKGYDQWIAPSLFLKKILVKGGIEEKKIAVIPNFVSLKEPIPIKKNELFYAGRICQEKGVKELLEAYLQIKTPRPLLKIAGEGPLKETLMEFTQKKGLNTVKWLGKLSQEEVQKTLFESSCSLVPSLWYENCSMSILESFACGRAVIASKQGGNTELVEEEKNGLLIDPSDQASFAKAMLRLTQEPTFIEEMARASFKTAKERFCPEKHLQSILNTYTNLKEK